MFLRAGVIGLFLLTGLGGRPAHAAVPAAPTEIEAKVSLESSLEKRLQSLLQKVLGTEDVVVMVNVELLPASEQELMPGVPIKDAAGGSDQAALTMIKTLSAAIILDEKTSEKDVELVRKTAASVLGIQDQRGDRLTIEKMTLRRDKGVFAASSPTSSREPLLSPGRLLSLLWLFAAAGGLLLLNFRFFGPLLGVLRDMLAIRAEAAVKPAPAAPPPAAPAPAAEQPQAAAPQPKALLLRESGRDQEEELPFSFLGDRHMPMLKVLMRKMDPRKAAVVVHYLPPRLAAQALLQLSPDARREVVRHMSKVVQLSERQVRGIERGIKTKIEYLMGGEEKLAEILDAAPAPLQEEMLQTVASENQVLGARLGTRIVLLDDIALLEAPELKLLTRRVPVQSLAAVLKANPELREKLLPKLTGGLGAWLTQEVELSRELLPDALALEQRKVLAALSQLVREGRIAIRKAGISPEALAKATSGEMMEFEEVVDLSGMDEPEDEGTASPKAPSAAAAAAPVQPQASVQPAGLSSESLEKLMGMFAAAMGMAQARAQAAPAPAQPAPQSWFDPFAPAPSSQSPHAAADIPATSTVEAAPAAAGRAAEPPLPAAGAPAAAPKAAEAAPFAGYPVLPQAFRPAPEPSAPQAVEESSEPAGPGQAPLDTAAAPELQPAPEAKPVVPAPPEDLLDRLTGMSMPEVDDDRIPDPPSGSGAAFAPFASFAHPDMGVPEDPGLSGIPEPPGFDPGPSGFAPEPPGFPGPDPFGPPEPPDLEPPAPPSGQV